MTQSTPGTTELRYNVRLEPFEPPADSEFREPGELWVNSTNLTMYVFTDDLDGQGTPGWVGVTSGQNNGTIIYSGDTQPTLKDIYPNIDNYNINFPLDPLPGTVWFDTSTNVLKVFYVVPSSPRELDENGEPVNTDDGWEAYSSSWVSVTTSHYLTEATASLVNDLTDQVAQLTTQIEQLEQIVNGAP